MFVCIFDRQVNGMKYQRCMKELRQENNMSQADLGKVLKCTQVAYGMYENGKRRLPICGLITLARFYDVSADYILGLTDSKERK